MVKAVLSLCGGPEQVIRCCISYIDSKIQAQLFNLNPDIIENLCMRFDNLGQFRIDVLYPTSSKLGSFFS